MDRRQFLGIDVGTGSARAGVFDDMGRLLGKGAHPIQLWHPAPDFYQQSSRDIWKAVVHAVRVALAEAGTASSAIAGIGFDATCSMVVVGGGGAPISVDPGGAPDQDVIVWMDHRAKAEAAEISAGGHAVLRHVGGAISPEMQTPKLLWLKRNLPERWAMAAHFMDLPDWLAFRATGQDVRSLCTTVCKWTYLGHEGGDGLGWNAGFFRLIGLGDIPDRGFIPIGTKVRPAGEAVAGGLSATAAAELGLVPGTAVAVSLIDAHAGALGVLGASIPGERTDFDRRVALIGGTSSCQLALSADCRFIPGVWGPYHGGLLPGLWLNEGGQSATGALIDHVLSGHAAFPALREEALKRNRSHFDLLNERVASLARDLPVPAAIAAHRHVQPDFHGNRSPRADAHLKGAVTGLTLDGSVDDLALTYAATLQAVAYGMRHILETMNSAGYRIDTILACGGGTKNQLLLREHADATGCRIVLPREPEAVLLGSAMLGAIAANRYTDLPTAMAAMSGVGRVIEPAGGDVAAFHNRKYRVFHRLHDDMRACREIMETI